MLLAIAISVFFGALAALSLHSVGQSLTVGARRFRAINAELAVMDARVRPARSQLPVRQAGIAQRYPSRPVAA